MNPAKVEKVNQREATNIVVAMAQARDETTPEGEALRMILRELREQRIVAHEIELILAPAINELDQAVGA